ncbi:hypothetical protein DVH05_001666 [Phytophthora capsici]|nr:hypothetical protein DVH05_001666 [Phytophthora capsici]
MPPQGPLPALPRHQVRPGIEVTSHVICLLFCFQVVRLAKASKRFVRVRPEQQTHDNSDKGNNNSKDVGVEKESKQIQTQEQDDQWEWQRVWKGAFDKMHHKLQSKSDETEALATENKVWLT